jgi:hypothetical protein
MVWLYAKEEKEGVYRFVLVGVVVSGVRDQPSW